MVVGLGRECSAHLKYDAVAERRSEIGAAVDEFTLRNGCAPRLPATCGSMTLAGRRWRWRWSPRSRNWLQYPIAQCRKLVAEKRAEKPWAIRRPRGSRDWVYVSDDDKFYRIDSDEWLSMQGFNARFNREVPMGEDGTISKSAAWLALEDYAIPNVTRSRLACRGPGACSTWTG